MIPGDPLIPAHGGYRDLKGFQLARLVYDVTVRFCDAHIDRRSRTHDQMVQAARSGVQNIAEGSQASGTSRRSEMKLTNVARASLEELRLDYEDYLRQRELPVWEPRHPALLRFKSRRVATLLEFRRWVRDEHRRAPADTDGHVPAGEGPCPSVPVPVLVANAVLSLLNLTCWLLDRQLAALAGKFEAEGGFTERLHRVRSSRR